MVFLANPAVKKVGLEIQVHKDFLESKACPAILETVEFLDLEESRVTR